MKVHKRYSPCRILSGMLCILMLLSVLAGCQVPKDPTQSSSFPTTLPGTTDKPTEPAPPAPTETDPTEPAPTEPAPTETTPTEPTVQVKSLGAAIRIWITTATIWITGSNGWTKAGPAHLHTLIPMVR